MHQHSSIEEIAQEIRRFITSTLQDYDAHSVIFRSSSRDLAILTCCGQEKSLSISNDIPEDVGIAAVELANLGLVRDMFEIRIRLV